MERHVAILARDIVSDGFEAVIRHGAVGDGRLIAHLLAPGGRVSQRPWRILPLTESRATIRRWTPPGDPLLALRNRLAVFRRRAMVRPTAVLRVNNGMFIGDAAVAGLGVALVPSFMMPRNYDRAHSRRSTSVSSRKAPTSKSRTLRDCISSAKLLALTRRLRLAFG